MKTDVTPVRFYLASQSPRRVELLRQLRMAFAQLSVDHAEVLAADLAPREQALRLARGKSLSARALSPAGVPVLAADTLIELDGEVLGKPRDREHGLAMLRALAGRWHTVHTGVALTAGARCESLVTSTQVQFTRISDPQIEAYWRTGEPVDKAGGYAVQGLGARFVARLRGSYSSVVGLPLFETVELLARFGVSPRHEP